MFKKVLLGVLAAGFAAFSGGASAQTFPDRPITMIIPFAAGGPTDVLGRVLAARMAEILGQQVVVENVGGAGGQTGSKRVEQSKADGYTILLGTVGTHAQSQTLNKKPLYDAAADFTPVALVAEVPIALVVRKDLPVKDLKEFIAYTKANKAKMSFASAGPGSAVHLGCVVANMVMDTDVTHVPYRGSGPAMQDLQGGRVDYMCEIISTAKPQIEGGTIKPIAIMTKQRSAVLPNLPTTAEQGQPNMEAYTWNAIFLPKGAPADVVRKLADAASQAVDTPAVREKLEGLGATVVAKDRRSPEYLAKFVKDEIAKWREPILKSGVQVN